MSPETGHPARSLRLVVVTLALGGVAAGLLLYGSAGEHMPVLWLIWLKLQVLWGAFFLIGLALLFCSQTTRYRKLPFRFSLFLVTAVPLCITGITFCWFCRTTSEYAPFLLSLISSAAPICVMFFTPELVLAAGGKDLAEPLSNRRIEAWLPMALVCLFAVVSFLCAFTPPWEYDEQEYHLGSVAYYFQHPRAWVVPGNVYSHFPQYVETCFRTTYGLMRELGTDALDGIYAGKFLNVILGILTALLAGWLARRCVWRNGEAAGAADDPFAYAMAFFYCSPAILVFSAVAYVEMALTFYLFLALCLFLVYAEVEPSETRRRFKCAALCGVVCGLAAGCKYTGILFGIAPLAVFFLVENLLSGSAKTLGKKVSLGARDAAVFSLAALILLSPWLIRNLALTGNPVFPLMYSVFGGRGWDAAHAAMWARAHAPGAVSLSEFGRSLWAALGNSALTPILAFLFIPLLILRPKTITPPARWVLAYALMYCVLWFLFTHRVDRFLAPALPALAVLSALGFAAWQEGWVGKALKGVVAVCLAFTLYQGLIVGSNMGAFTVGLHPGEKERFLRENTDFYDVYQAIQFVNQNVKVPKAKVLFFAEARAFYCEVDWLAPTVFNTNPLETALREGVTTSDVAAQLRKKGFTHLLVNWIEFQRLHKTYGAYEDFAFEKWAKFRDECLTQLATFGKPHEGGKYPIVVYAIGGK